MSDFKKSVKQGFQFAAAGFLLPFAFILLKLVAIVEETYWLRKACVRRGWLGYTPPDPEAIRECEQCEYEGVLAVDKHRPAPMSDVNWELRCPECSTTYEGPLHADDVGEYINHCRSTDIMGAMMSFGNYPAFKTVTTHNSKYVLSKEQISKLESLSCN